jgi:thiamine biosynthesis protein ThiS
VPTIVLNGEDHQAPDGATVATLLAALELDPRQVAVERNREIVPRATYADTSLNEGDRLEVVTFVGGG